MSVRLTMGTSRMALSPSGLWVAGQEIQPGVEVLSGSFYITAAGDQVIPVK